MRITTWLIAAILLAAAFAGGCGGQSSTAPPAGKPYMEGAITQIAKDRVLVEEVPDQQQGNKCWMTVSDRTRVLIKVGEEVKLAGPAQLAVGQRVQVWVSGAILESYPCQAGADAILILQ